MMTISDEEEEEGKKGEKWDGKGKRKEEIMKLMKYELVIVK